MTKDEEPPSDADRYLAGIFGITPEEVRDAWKGARYQWPEHLRREGEMGYPGSGYGPGESGDPTLAPKPSPEAKHRRPPYKGPGVPADPFDYGPPGLGAGISRPKPEKRKPWWRFW